MIEPGVIKQRNDQQGQCGGDEDAEDQRYREPLEDRIIDDEESADHGRNAGQREKMDCTGYPRKLQRDELSPLARMMAIADIFEALTAVDRPYKKGKTLSEAIKIMSFMKKEGHIDPELFDLFLRSGTHQQYAERFLRPEQIDAVDIAAFVDVPPSPDLAKTS